MMLILKILSIVGLMFLGYVIGRILEIILIDTWLMGWRLPSIKGNH